MSKRPYEPFVAAPRMAWLWMWDALAAARQAFGEAVTPSEQLAALADMTRLAMLFRSACDAYGYAIDRTAPTPDMAALQKDCEEALAKAKALKESLGIDDEATQAPSKDREE